MVMSFLCGGEKVRFVTCTSYSTDDLPRKIDKSLFVPREYKQIDITVHNIYQKESECFFFFHERILQIMKMNVHKCIVY